ncbi:MAG: YlxR family protein [Acidimicrobiales bacterium]|nr:YlxR family protein [Acidimicrobiales bacterium]
MRPTTTVTPSRVPKQTSRTEADSGGAAVASTGPRRTCVGCRTTRTSSELVRVARDAEGNLAIGRTLPGRGAWLCRDDLTRCSDHAIRKGGFARAFRTKVTADALEALRLQIEAFTR